MTSVTYNSTGKLRSNQTDSIGIRECFTCPKLTQGSANRKDYERPQPVKIAQLLCEAGSSRKTQGSAKRILPERLGGTASARKTRLNENQTGTNEQSTHFNKYVHRNLNFNDISPRSANRKDYERPQPVKITQLLCEVGSSRKTQGSAKRILPERLGQTISARKTRLNENQTGTNKQSTYFNKCVRRNLNFNDISPSGMKLNSKNENKSNQCTADKGSQKETCKAVRRKSLLLPPNSIKDNHLKQYSVGQNKYSKLPQVSEEILHTDKKTNIHVYSEIKQEDIETKENNISILSNELPKENNELLPSEHVEASNTFLVSSAYQNSNENEINSTNEMFINVKDNDTSTENLHNAIYVDENEIIRLECDLRSLLTETEENVSKIKSTLTCVTRLLSMNSNKIMGNRRCSKTKETCKIMIDKEVQVEGFKVIPRTEGNLEIFDLHVPEISITGTKYDNESDENNKENHETTNLERISDIDSIRQNCSIQQKTPTSIKYKDNRSFSEYMALKSNMKFLETPDIKKYKSFRHNKSTDASTQKTYISNKVLRELRNLYCDSPESN